MTQQKYGKAQAAVLDADFLHKEIDLKGRLITSIDPLLVQNNFITMQNMRYGDLNPVSVRGMTLVGNGTAGYNQVVTMKQLRKWEPYETHVYAQINSANCSAIFDQTTAPPTAGNWSNVYQLASVYANNTAYAVGDIVLPPTANGFYYECITAGNSGSSPPTFLDANNTTEYSTVNNTVVKFQAIKGNLKGFFSDAPQGCLMFCNGRHQLVIPGDRVKLGTVLNIGSTNPFEEVFGLDAEPNGFFYDYTDIVNNKSGTDFATLYTSAGSAVLDNNTLLLAHFNGNNADSSLQVHTITAGANAAYNSTYDKFGNNAAIFNNTADEYFEVTANGSYSTVFNWNNTTSWTIDAWVRITSSALNKTVYCLRGNGTNHEISLKIDGSGTLRLYLNNNTANSTLSCSIPIPLYTYKHIAAQYNSTDGRYKLFVNGMLGYNNTSSTVITGTPTYFKPLIGRGNNGSSVVNPFLGYIDELRISNLARYTEHFTVPIEEYSETPSGNSANASVNLYIGSPIKLDEVGFKLKTVNAVASTLTVSAYNGTDWENSTSTTDGTNNSTTSMNQSGNIAFNCANAQPTLLKGVMSYWYKFNWTALSNGTSIYYMYGGAPIQQVTDIWDGEMREVQGCIRWDNSAGHFKDKLAVVVKRDTTYSPFIHPVDNNMRMILTPGTFLSLGGFTADDYIMTGCMDRAMALQYKLPSDFTGEGKNNASEIIAHYTGNTKPSTSWLHYWTGGSFNNTTNYLDGTIGKNGANNCTVNHDGVLTWSPTDESNESRTSINQSPELYWYKFGTNATFDANVAVDQIMYIPAPQKLPTYYTFPVFWLNSVGLCGRNELRLGYPGALNVFNGNGSRVIEIGDASPLVAGGSLPLVHSTGISETLILTKSDETWTLVKLDDDKIKLTKMSDTHGCAAPYTFAVCDLGAAGNNIARAVALWQSSDAILMYMDGNIIDVSKDIRNYFTDMHDANKTVRINPNMINNSTGFFDPLFNEYHWCFAQNNNTTLDKEFVFDVPKQKWFEMVRGNNETIDNRLTCGALVSDNNSARYIYAGCADGKIKKLEHNKTFDTLGINCTLQTGFYADGNNTNIISTVRHAKVLFKPILNIANATLYHYHDGNNSVYDTVTSFSMNGSNYFSNTKKSDAYDAEFHGWKLTATLDSSASSTQQDFEPLAITYMYKNKREDI